MYFPFTTHQCPDNLEREGTVQPTLGKNPNGHRFFSLVLFYGIMLPIMILVYLSKLSSCCSARV